MIVDSQSVKTAHGGEMIGIDGFKKVKGRKRHIIADTLGLVWGLLLTAANAADGTQLVPLVKSVEGVSQRLKAVLGDGGYGIANYPRRFVEAFGDRYKLNISKKPPGAESFVPQPIRWIVERCFAWMVHSRRLSKDYERTVQSSAAFVRIACIRRALRHATAPSQTESTLAG